MTKEEGDKRRLDGRRPFMGTTISDLTKRCGGKSGTGIKGVYRRPSGSYYAMLMLRGRIIYLGTADSLEGAVDLRREGEERYYRPIIEAYENERKETVQP